MNLVCVSERLIKSTSNLAHFFHHYESMLRPFTVALLVLLYSGGADGHPWSRPNIQVGLASFYGPGFNGDRTANGEIFDQRKLVAAHRTLPLGSVVRVTNLDNGRDVVLRVIDRGPYGKNHRKGCIIDVSKGAASRLGFVRQGIIQVRVEVIRYGTAGNRNS
jgi:rare lipoprotein A (peptidoglycan hydrolase)